MDVQYWLQIISVCFLGAISPGPSLALVVGNSISKGRSYGIATSLGHAVGIGLWAFLTAVGIAKVVLETSGLLLVVQSLGACLIAYVGFRTLVIGSTLSNNEIDLRSDSSGIALKGAVEGFLISLFNPKIALFFLAIFSHFVKPDGGWTQTGLMGITAGLVDAAWYVFVVFVLTGVSISRFPKGAENVIQKISGSLLILVAVYLLNVIVRGLL